MGKFLYSFSGSVLSLANSAMLDVAGVNQAVHRLEQPAELLMVGDEPPRRLSPWDERYRVYVVQQGNPECHLFSFGLNLVLAFLDPDGGGHLAP